MLVYPIDCAQAQLSMTAGCNDRGRDIMTVQVVLMRHKSSVHVSSSLETNWSYSVETL